MSQENIENAKKDFLPPPGWKRNPVLLQLKKLDEALTYRLALAYDEKSTLGELRSKLLLFEYSAHTLACFAVAGFFWWMSISSTSKALFTNIILGMIIDVFVVAVTKAIARRRRPGVSRETYEKDSSSSNLSFPSGFVSRATMIFLVLVNQDFFALIPIVFLSWAVLMAVTKLLLARFFIFDAAAGIPIGIIVYKFLELVWLSPEDVATLEAFFGGQPGDI